jgi:4-hydroxy-tetrahydrodipicolinate reductase
MIRIAISGASGRMGANLIQSCDKSELSQLTVALERPGSDAEGRDAGVQSGIEAQNVAIQCQLQGTES